MESLSGAPHDPYSDSRLRFGKSQRHPRHRYISVRCTWDEYFRIQQLAKRSQLSISKFVLLSTLIVTLDWRSILTSIRELMADFVLYQEVVQRDAMAEHSDILDRLSQRLKQLYQLIARPVALLEEAELSILTQDLGKIDGDRRGFNQ